MGNDEQNICVTTSRADAIARLNDQLRRTGNGGLIVVTRSVQNLPGFDGPSLRATLASHQGFDADNDPHGERDFGSLSLWGADLLWKIDCYDTKLEFGSDDAADSAITTRVLTVMLQAEY